MARKQRRRDNVETVNKIPKAIVLDSTRDGVEDVKMRLGNRTSTRNQRYRKGMRTEKSVCRKVEEQEDVVPSRRYRLIW